MLVWMTFKNSWPDLRLNMKMAPSETKVLGSPDSIYDTEYLLKGLVVKLPSNVLQIVTQ